MRGEKEDNVDYFKCWRERFFFPSPSSSSFFAFCFFYGDITDSSSLC